MRKLTKQTAQDIRKSFLIHAEAGLTENQLINLLANVAIALIEITDEQPEWFQERNNNDSSS